MMFDGERCGKCGVHVDGQTSGHPRLCEDCGRNTRHSKANRRDAANRDYVSARELANRHGLELARHSEFHYQLFPMNKTWILNVYPGNCRLYNDRSKETPPHLGIETPWALIDVVRTTIEKLTPKP
jgi:hypothetical protein